MTGAYSRGGASLQLRSSNRKIAPQISELLENRLRRNTPIGPMVSTTYVSIAATCPSSCPFRAGACYALAGMRQLNGQTLDADASELEPDGVMAAEASLIDGLYVHGVPQDGPRGWGRALRLHVSGDVTSTRGARMLSAAAKRWLDRGGGPVWTYTHRWRTVDRYAWPWVSVLASVERAADVQRARDRGYVAAVTVPEYPDGHRAFSFGGARAIPCPAEIGRMTCAQCGLCMDDEALAERGLAIAFAAHGLNTDRIRLPVLQPQPRS
jgi:hypothetical protein